MVAGFLERGGVLLFQTGLVFAHDVEGFEVEDVRREDGGFDAPAALETPLSVAEKLDEFLFRGAVWGEACEHAFAHLRRRLRLLRGAGRSSR